MNRRLAEAVIAAFQDKPDAHLRARFAQFDEREWLRTIEWLHTSGLALHFLGRANALGIADSIPARILDGLETNLAQNRVRTQHMFDEFVEINVEFQRSKLSYANLKGFTLAPRSCFDPAYRYQHDLDFLVPRREAELCREAVERHGYRLTAVSGDTWEFKAGHGELSTLRDLYKVRSQRSLELHFISETEQDESHRNGDRLSRLQLQVWNGFEFPALSECDKLLAQALHLFKHFKSEWTRTVWMLEYATAIRSHQGDESFWRETVAALADVPEKKIAVGVASLITSRTFGVVPPAQFLSCTVDELSKRLRLWVDRYQDELVYLEHPGSKLYLLLQDVLSHDLPEWKRQRRMRLLPLHAPPRVILAARSKKLWPRVKAASAQLRFVWGRLRFHVTEGFRYKIESARWKRFVADLRT